MTGDQSLGRSWNTESHPCVNLVTHARSHYDLIGFRVTESGKLTGEYLHYGPRRLIQIVNTGENRSDWREWIKSSRNMH